MCGVCSLQCDLGHLVSGALEAAQCRTGVPVGDPGHGRRTSQAAADNVPCKLITFKFTIRETRNYVRNEKTITRERC